MSETWSSLVVVREVDKGAGAGIEVPDWKPGAVLWLTRKERERAEQAIGQPFTVGMYLHADVNLGARVAASLRFDGWELAPDDVLAAAERLDTESGA